MLTASEHASVFLLLSRAGIPLPDVLVPRPEHLQEELVKLTRCCAIRPYFRTDLRLSGWKKQIYLINKQKQNHREKLRKTTADLPDDQETPLIEQMKVSVSIIH